MTLGLFPLNIVLFPSSRMPLHVFEPRYRQLVTECIAKGATFGINYVEASHLHPVGCLARVVAITETFADGRMDIIVAGVGRYRLQQVRNDEAAYLMGDVEPVDDDVAVIDPLLVERVAALYNEIVDLVYGDEGPHYPMPSAGDAARLHPSFVMAPKSGLDNDQKQRLLEMRSENQRLEFLADHLQDIVPAVRKADLIQRIITSDGYFPPA